MGLLLVGAFIFLYKISFGDTPNSSSIGIFMPCAIFDYIGAFLRNGFAHVDNVIPVIKTIAWLLLSRLPGNKPHRNSPEPSEPCLCNLHQHVPELPGTLRNLPTPSGINLSEPSGTFLRNLHQHTPELSGTFRNLPEPAPATRTSAHRSLSGLKTPLAYAVGGKKIKSYIEKMGKKTRRRFNLSPVSYLFTFSSMISMATASMDFSGGTNSRTLGASSSQETRRFGVSGSRSWRSFAVLLKWPRCWKWKNGRWVSFNQIVRGT